jgi:hypothetical protein
MAYHHRRQGKSCPSALPVARGCAAPSALGCPALICQREQHACAPQLLGRQHILDGDDVGVVGPQRPLLNDQRALQQRAAHRVVALAVRKSKVCVRAGVQKVVCVWGDGLFQQFDMPKLSGV